MKNEEEKTQTTNDSNVLDSTKLLLVKVWSKKFWQEIFETIEFEYAQLLVKAGVPCGTISPEYTVITEHRFEQAIRNLALDKNAPNLHLGLTSSDIEDNVRALRIRMSYQAINVFLLDIAEKLGKLQKNVGEMDVLAKTHLVTAGVVPLKKRIKLWESKVLEITLDNPVPRYKGIHGSLGINHIQELLGITKDDLLEIIMELERSNDDKFTVQDESTQTGDHFYEMKMANQIELISMVVGKICNDLRQMIAFEQARIGRKDVASTAFAQKKNPNPWRLERASAMLEDLTGISGKIARIGANCLLERTLTNQSILNSLFERSFSQLINALDDVSTELSSIQFKSDVTPEDYEQAGAEERVVREVMSGRFNRLQAYNREHNS